MLLFEMEEYTNVIHFSTNWLDSYWRIPLCNETVQNNESTHAVFQQIQTPFFCFFTCYHFTGKTVLILI